jgi:hypothetical protein
LHGALELTQAHFKTVVFVVASSRQADSEHLAGGWKPPLWILKCDLANAKTFCRR